MTLTLRRTARAAVVRELGQHTWLAIPLPSDTVVVLDHLEPEEVDTVVASGWWRADALASHETFVPRDLNDMMSTAVVAVGGQS